MSGWNLPPGVSVNDIPGNRPEDEAWEKAWDQVSQNSMDIVAKAFPKDRPVEATIWEFLYEKACECFESPEAMLEAVRKAGGK